MDDKAKLDAFLRFKTITGLKKRGLPMTPEYIERLEFELKVISDMSYQTYFLIVADLCRFMREKRIMFNVRGSGCGSVVVWGLGISNRHLDPLVFKLPFERFLNPSRVSLPDLDIDIDDLRKDEVFQYTVQKYGVDKVARIITFGTLGAKAAVRAVCRAVQDQISNYQEVGDRIASAIPAGKVSIKEAMDGNEFLQSQRAAYPDVFDYAEKVEGRVSHPSVHAAGVIIAPDKMTKFMPLYYEPPSERTDEAATTQWDMYDCDKAGMLKMDYLGLKTLRVIDQTVRAINHIKKHLGHSDVFDIDYVDYKDQKTWDLLARGELSGIFQVERGFVRDFAKRMNLQKGDFWQLPVLISIIRPGMMDAGMTEVYLNRASGLEDPVPPHPLLEELLRPTYGCMVFQEDLMWVCRIMANFTMAEADEMRRCVAKKMPEKLLKIWPAFLKGCLSNGVTEDEAKHVWELMETFGRYGFNNAHAAAYGMVSYWTAYLKANAPLPYMTFLINSEAGVTNKDDGYNWKVAEYVEEARRLGIPVLPPCVKRSSRWCKMVWQENHIRFGLEIIKKVSQSSVDWIIDAANRSDSFKDFVLNRFEIKEVETTSTTGETKKEWRSYSRIGKSDFESLILAGALDVYGLDRSVMMHILPTVLKLTESYWLQVCKVKNGSKVRVTPESVKEKIDAIHVDEDQIADPMSLEDQLAKEREYTGCYLSQSPFSPFQEEADSCNTTTGELAQDGWPPANTAVMMAMASRVKLNVCKNGKSAGKTMAFLTFSGVGGDVGGVCFPNDWERVNRKSGAVETGKVYLVRAKRDQNGRSDVIVQDMIRLSKTE